MQYFYYSEGQFKVARNPVTGTKCRTGQLNHKFVEQQLIADIWTDIGGNDAIAGEGCRFREGARAGDYVVDVELEVAGFLLAENDGWENIGGAQGDWNPEKQLSGESVNFWAKGRNGLTISDSVGGNDVSILPACYRGNGVNYYYNYTANVLSSNDLVLYINVELATLTTGRFCFFSQGGNCWFRVSKTENQWNFICTDGTNSRGITIPNATLPITARKYSFKIVHDQNGSTTIFESGNNVGTASGIFTNVAAGTNSVGSRNGADTISSDINILNLKIYSDLTEITCIAHYEFSGGNIESDLSGNNVNLLIFDPILTNLRGYSEFGSTFMLDNGGSLWHRYNYPSTKDVYLLSGGSTTQLLLYGYVKINDILGDLVNHNLADSLLDIPPWDRSDITKFNDVCRASIYYDVTNTTRWHISEINEVTIIGYTNTDHQGEEFVKITDNSYDARFLLTELFSFAINKTGNDLTKVLRYTGDSDIPNILYLSDPYTDVLKITANSDSEFKFNVNNAIVYSKQDIWNSITTVPKLNVNEDEASRIFRWHANNTDISSEIAGTVSSASNIINSFNSFKGYCGTQCTQFWNIFNHYFPNNVFASALFGHQANYTDKGFYDLGFKIMFYKNPYFPVPYSELQADEKYVTEPLRKTSYNLNYYYTHDWWVRISDYARDVSHEVSSPIDNLTMKLPMNSTFVFPVKSVNEPNNWLGYPLNADAAGVPNPPISHANGMGTFVTGITGLVSMPFTLVQITGTGTVKVDGITYTLPADNATLKTVLQGYAKYYNEFEILTNTGGIEAEWLIYYRRILLWRYNKIVKGIITGDITCESISTITPILTNKMVINMGDSESWTLDHSQQKRMGGVFRVPFGKWGNFNCTFEKQGTKRPRPVEVINNVSNITQPTDELCIAGPSVIDQCFAARLDPRNDTFSGSLELTFTTYDGSDCYYTLDGSTPDATKTLYTIPFTISATTTVKWINIKTDYADSHVNTRVITKV